MNFSASHKGGLGGLPHHPCQSPGLTPTRTGSGPWDVGGQRMSDMRLLPYWTPVGPCPAQALWMAARVRGSGSCKLPWPDPGDPCGFICTDFPDPLCVSQPDLSGALWVRSSAITGKFERMGPSQSKAVDGIKKGGFGRLFTMEVPPSAGRLVSL